MGLPVDLVVAIGPGMMMKAVSDLTRTLSIPTLVSLNSLMVDGTGMCGACRVTVGGTTKFVCVDGPEFDGHQVDFDDLMTRLKRFTEQEKTAVERWSENCRMTNPLQTLTNNTPVSNLAGAAGSTSNFKFAVPSGVSSVTIALSGGTGDADLYVKYGQLATTSVYDQRPYLGGNSETVTITYGFSVTAQGNLSEFSSIASSPTVTTTLTGSQPSRWHQPRTCRGRQRLGRCHKVGQGHARRSPPATARGRMPACRRRARSQTPPGPR